MPMPQPPEGAAKLLVKPPTISQWSDQPAQDFACFASSDHAERAKSRAPSMEIAMQKQLDRQLERISTLLSQRNAELLQSLNSSIAQLASAHRVPRSNSMAERRSGVDLMENIARAFVDGKICKNSDPKTNKKEGGLGASDSATPRPMKSLRAKEERVKPVAFSAFLKPGQSGEELELHEQTKRTLNNSRKMGTAHAILGEKMGGQARADSFTQRQAAKVARSDYFIGFCNCLVIANTIFIGAESDRNVHLALDHPDLKEPRWCVIGNRIFAACFTVELLIRMAAFRRKFFCGREWRWNFFDLLLVLSAIGEEMLESFNFTFVRILRLARLIRAGRIIRVIHFFKALRLMVCCIFTSLASLFWALLLLFLVMYCFSIVCLYGVTTWLRENPNAAYADSASFDDDDRLGDKELRDAISLNFRGLPRTLFSMLASITGGQDWYDVVQPFMSIHAAYVFGFLFYILFVLFGVLNVVTGVFVESAMKLRDRDLLIHGEIENTEEFLKDMKELFYECDTDRTGSLTWPELQNYFKNERVVAYFTVHQLDVSDASFIFKMLDYNDDGIIAVDEFAMGCLRLKGQAKTSDMLRIMQESSKINQQIFDDLDHLSDQLDYMQHMFEVVGNAAETEEQKTSHGWSGIYTWLKSTGDQ